MERSLQTDWDTNPSFHSESLILQHLKSRSFISHLQFSHSTKYCTGNWSRQTVKINGPLILQNCININIMQDSSNIPEEIFSLCITTAIQEHLVTQQAEGKTHSNKRLEVLESTFANTGSVLQCQHNIPQLDIKVNPDLYMYFVHSKSYPKCLQNQVYLNYSKQLSSENCFRDRSFWT